MSKHGVVSDIWVGIKITNKEHIKVLKALDHYYERCTYSDFGFIGFRRICQRTKLNKATVRRVCRALARKGLAEYSRGLFNEDGEVAGSGYAITMAGHVALQVMGKGK